MVPNRELVSDKSPLADILSRYEKHLRSERGLVTATIISYQPFIRKFLLKRFREQPFSLRKLKPSDISDFVLRHGKQHQAELDGRRALAVPSDPGPPRTVTEHRDYSHSQCP